MAEGLRYAKTPKGSDEIGQRRNNLRGKMRTMLILVDPSKSADQLREQGARIGVAPDFLDTMVREGYIVALGPGAPAASVTAAIAANDAPAAISTDELSRFREAKDFMNQSVVDALGIRAFLFTLRLERCATRAGLALLLPDYEQAIRKRSEPDEARLLIDRMRELLA